MFFILLRKKTKVAKEITKLLAKLKKPLLFFVQLCLQKDNTSYQKNKNLLKQFTCYLFMSKSRKQYPMYGRAVLFILMW